MNTRRMVWFAVVVVVGVLGAARSARGVVALAGAMSELNNMQYHMDALLKNKMAEAIQEKNFAKFQKYMSEMRQQMIAYKTKSEAAYQEADRVARKMEANHTEKDPSKWEEKDRAAYEKAKADRETCMKHKQAYQALSGEIKKVSQVADRMDAKTFSKFAPQMTQRLHSLQAALDQFRVTTGSAPLSTGNASPVKIENQTKDVWFLVGSTWLKPGDKPLTVAGDKITIRALAMTKNRDFVMNKQPTAHTTVNERSPYVFRFTVDAGGGTGETSWECVEETYEWHGYGPGSAKFEPQVSTTKRKNDTLTWTPPRVSAAAGEAPKVFTFGVRAELKWNYERKGAMGNVKRTDNESANGTLGMTVMPK